MAQIFTIDGAPARAARCSQNDGLDLVQGTRAGQPSGSHHGQQHVSKVDEGGRVILRGNQSAVRNRTGLGETMAPHPPPTRTP